jgi:hypothetical protein
METVGLDKIVGVKTGHCFVKWCDIRQLNVDSTSETVKVVLVYLLSPLSIHCNSLGMFVIAMDFVHLIV